MDVRLELRLRDPSSRQENRDKDRRHVNKKAESMFVEICQILHQFGLIGLLTGSGGLRPPRICCLRMRHSGRLHILFEL